MNLRTLFEKEGFAGLVVLAKKADTDPRYLWQIADGRRTPSPKLANRLVAADKRLSLNDIFRIDPTEPSKKAA